ncbi:lymphoid-specific helicase [Limosa lapponica baueri]|uniref:Lymphoid-specific helicase n=1 Tax=Limosa lapponica baueri TaxID=1758121 RepID=A0A2I0TGG3_LIMLA|nr:lymphoid-specific helicase [Limosa lapponica baueri]
MRYKRLQHLLEKSNIYSKFLLTKMEQQQLEEQRRKEKLEKKREMMLKSAKMLWENGINGILADEMGLGKTIQCIATIALMVERGVPGPFLVCGPLSTLPNWMSEFKRFTPEIPLMLYHGPQQERRKLVRKIHGRQGSLQIHPVVITSFEIAMRDRNALQVS